MKQETNYSKSQLHNKKYILTYRSINLRNKQSTFIPCSNNAVTFLNAVKN